MKQSKALKSRGPKGIMQRHPELANRLRFERVSDLAKEYGCSSGLLSQHRRQLGITHTQTHGRNGVLNRLGWPDLRRSIEDALMAAYKRGILDGHRYKSRLGVNSEEPNG